MVLKCTADPNAPAECRARSVVFMDATGPDPKDRNCTFADALHLCKGVNCAGQVPPTTV